jgi:hypothetical protein
MALNRMPHSVHWSEGRAAGGPQLRKSVRGTSALSDFINVAEMFDRLSTRRLAVSKQSRAYVIFAPD